MVCLGFEPGAEGWKAQTNPLSYGGLPLLNFLCSLIFEAAVPLPQNRTNLSPKMHELRKSSCAISSLFFFGFALLLPTNMTQKMS